ncbi:hypothetical protein JG688_00017683 [Phytophthora aleatoria]|uniref:Myb-like domain-containing protein n=1 Tax=Phytophthora aleatoria TaxID=2496075 RepID=A0A8J5IA25_9STRA|nr:hypothetical protein JG688_00017683 [Phytophthora aleatoria]
MPNTTGWTEGEDVWLCTAYTNISDDRATGTDQERWHLWERIHAVYCQIATVGATPRNAGSLQSRWSSLIRPDVSLFASLYGLVEAEGHSGWTDDDYFREANNRFSAKREQQNANALEGFKKNPNRTKPRPKPDVFRFKHCFDVLETAYDSCGQFRLPARGPQYLQWALLVGIFQVSCNILFLFKRQPS